MDNIYLIGMMGSGKSTIGEKLANNLNMEYVDIDDDIESVHQMTIVDIFNQLGEKKFREIESAYFLEKAKQTNQVFSTGGGIILNIENRDILKNNGRTFFLETDCKILLNRIKNISSRPLLDNKSPIETISSVRRSAAPTQMTRRELRRIRVEIRVSRPRPTNRNSTRNNGTKKRNWGKFVLKFRYESSNPAKTPPIREKYEQTHA